MKRFFIYLSVVIMMSCNSDMNKKDDTLKQEQLKNETEIVNYTIDELFYFQDISNGNLLATSSGKLSTQSERAMIFVPAGGGEEDTPEFEVIQSDDVHITLSDHKIITDYHLFNFPMNNDALLLKYETKTLVQLIRYAAENNTFQSLNLKQFGLQANEHKDSTYFINDTSFTVGNRTYQFNGQTFETINRN